MSSSSTSSRVLNRQSTITKFQVGLQRDKDVISANFSKKNCLYMVLHTYYDIYLKALTEDRRILRNLEAKQLPNKEQIDYGASQSQLQDELRRVT